MRKNQKGIVHLGILLVALVAIGAIGYLMYQSGQLVEKIQQPNQEETPTITETAESPSPTPNPTTTNWKAHNETYKDINFQVSYPSAWNISLRERASYFEEGKSILITDKKPYPVNNTVHIQASNLVAPYYMPEGSTDEEIIQGYVNWDISNLLRPLEDYPVKSSTKTETQIDNKKAIKYVYMLERPNEKSDYKINWIFIPLRPYMVIILSHGEDQFTLDQILSTFKFVE